MVGAHQQAFGLHSIAFALLEEGFCNETWCVDSLHTTINVKVALTRQEEKFIRFASNCVDLNLKLHVQFYANTTFL